MAILVRAIDGMSNHTAADLRGDMEDLIQSEGVVATDHLEVTPANPADMSVDVAPGVAYVENDAWTITSDNVQRYWDVKVTSTENLAISSNPSGSTRIDLIVLQVDDTVVPDANASNVATLEVVEGTPGAGAPALPDDALLLATITVETGETEILVGDIQDDREVASFLQQSIKEYVDTEIGDIPQPGLKAIRYYTSNDTWSKPDDLNFIVVEVVGAGGAGGGQTAQNSASAGGGGGGYARRFYDGEIDSTVSVTVGVGATGTSTAGTSGGNSSFGGPGDAWYTAATGGAGGGSNNGIGGAGGVGTDGDLLISGGRGDNGHTSTTIQSGRGGNSKYGFGGGGARPGNNPGFHGGLYGGGGGGACQTNGSGRIGGNGADGIVIVYEY